jgi:hypothetical protein
VCGWVYPAASALIHSNLSSKGKLWNIATPYDRKRKTWLGKKHTFLIVAGVFEVRMCEENLPFAGV